MESSHLLLSKTVSPPPPPSACLPREGADQPGWPGRIGPGTLVQLQQWLEVEPLRADPAWLGSGTTEEKCEDDLPSLLKKEMQSPRALNLT